MDVMPTTKVSICFIFMSSSSVAPYFVAIARPRDFAVLRSSDARSLFGMNASELQQRPNHSDH